VWLRCAWPLMKAPCSCATTLDEEALPAFVWDSRIGQYRAQAHFYRDSLDYRKRENIPHINSPLRYCKHSMPQQPPPDPHPHQSESMDAWLQHDHQGIVALPTGTGKSQVAILAMLIVQRSTLKRSSPKIRSKNASAPSVAAMKPARTSKCAPHHGPVSTPLARPQ